MSMEEDLMAVEEPELEDRPPPTVDDVKAAAERMLGLTDNMPSPHFVQHIGPMPHRPSEPPRYNRKMRQQISKRIGAIQKAQAKRQKNLKGTIVLAPSDKK